MSEEPRRELTAIDLAVSGAALAFADAIGALSGDSILREGVLKAAICNMVIELEREFPDCKDVLEDTLRTQADIMRDEANE